MKTHTRLLVLVFLCISSLMNAQKKDSLRFGAMQQFNFTFGESGPGIGLTLVNGVRYQRFFVGIGADYHTGNYNYEASSAVYLDGRYYINKSKNFFVKFDGGVNFITGRQNTWYASKYDKKVGYYWGSGIGFKARLSKDVHYVFDVSYVMRQQRYDFRYEDWRFPNQWMTEKYDSRWPMIVVSMGMEIF